MRKNKEWWIEFANWVINEKWNPAKYSVTALISGTNMVNCRLCRNFKFKNRNPALCLFPNKGPCPGCIFNSNTESFGCTEKFPQFKSTYLKLLDMNNILNLDFDTLNNLISKRQSTWIKILEKLESMDESDFDRDYFPEILEMGD